MDNRDMTANGRLIAQESNVFILLPVPVQETQTATADHVRAVLRHDHDDVQRQQTQNADQQRKITSYFPNISPTSNKTKRNNDHCGTKQE